MRVLERRQVLQERVLDVQVVGLMNALEPRRQPLQIEAHDIPLPFVRRVFLCIHARELSHVGVALVGGQRPLRARGGPSERQQQGNEYKAMHEGLHGCGYREPAAGCVNFTAASVNACTNDAPALMRFARVM
jgi:hypothetical protein